MNSHYSVSPNLRFPISFTSSLQTPNPPPDVLNLQHKLNHCDLVTSRSLIPCTLAHGSPPPCPRQQEQGSIRGEAARPAHTFRSPSSLHSSRCAVKLKCWSRSEHTPKSLPKFQVLGNVWVSKFTVGAPPSANVRQWASDYFVVIVIGYCANSARAEPTLR